MFLTLGWILVVFTFVYYLPGRLVTILLLRDELPEERFVTSFASGFLLVNVTSLFISGLRGIWEPYYMTRSLVLVVAMVWTVALGVLVFRRRRDRIREFWQRPTRGQWALWVWTAVVTLLFAVNYHRAVISEDDCVIRAAAAVVDCYGQRELLDIPGEDGLSRYHESALGAFDPDKNDFLASNQSQRLGPTVMVAPALALFGPLGLRLVYLLQGLLLPAFGLVLGLRLLSSRWGPWMVAALLPLSPYAMNTLRLDENFMSSIWGTLMLVLLLRPRPSWALAGAALSLFLGIRHVGVLMVPAVLAYIIMVAPQRRRALLIFLGSLFLFSLPYIVMHTRMLLDSGALFEGAIDRPPLEHSFFGIRFNLHVLLNFPFIESLSRSPYAAYPPMILFPLDFIRGHGLLLSALLIPGLLHLRTLPRPRQILLLGWVIPLWCLLMVQSNWVEPNKMGVPASAYAPVALALAAGAEWLTDRWRTRYRRGAIAAVGFLVPLALYLGLRTVQTPVDERVYPASPDYIEEFFGQEAVLSNVETPEHLEYERSRFGLTLLPDVVPDPLRAGHGERLIEDLGRELAAPNFVDWEVPSTTIAHWVMMGRSQYMGPFTLARQVAAGDLSSDWLAFRTCSGAPSTEGAIDATLDLSESPTTWDTPFAPGSEGGAPVMDLTTPGWYILRGLEVPFAREPINVALGLDCDGLVNVFITPMGLREVRLDIPGLRMTIVDTSTIEGHRIRTRIPRDGLILVLDYRSVSPEREYQRFGRIDDGVAQLWPARPQ